MNKYIKKLVESIFDDEEEFDNLEDQTTNEIIDKAADLYANTLILPDNYIGIAIDLYSAWKYNSFLGTLLKLSTVYKNAFAFGFGKNYKETPEKLNKDNALFRLTPNIVNTFSKKTDNEYNSYNSCFGYFILTCPTFNTFKEFYDFFKKFAVYINFKNLYISDVNSYVDLKNTFINFSKPNRAELKSIIMLARYFNYSWSEKDYYYMVNNGEEVDDKIIEMKEKNIALLNLDIRKDENNRYYINLDPLKGYQLTYKKLNSAFDKFDLYVKPARVSIQFRSGLSMQYASDWPLLEDSEFMKCLNHFKNCTFIMLDINRVKITQEGLKLLHDFDIFHLQFSECKLSELSKEPIYKRDFKDPNITIDSDKPSFNKLIK